MLNRIFNLFIVPLPPRVNRIKHLSTFIFYLFILAGVTIVGDSLHLAEPLRVCIGGIYLLNLFILKVKRLNDINYSGWWALILLIPVLGVLFGLALFVIQGTKGNNRFGPEPKKASKLEYFIASFPLLLLVFGILYKFLVEPLIMLVMLSW
jgi:uncharacterized membrane protein YhaH (DUF805 family)